MGRKKSQEVAINAELGKKNKNRSQLFPKWVEKPGVSGCTSTLLNDRRWPFFCHVGIGEKSMQGEDELFFKWAEKNRK
ncbi:hypothetical protein [Bacillus capparidis]|uniref:Uncharacterized protein n=1 Tax=Bacillus capparidis TaxID=1840411 RepID=A0ABS4CWX9_9BACI|nr:hypothetical protein [Bacillus capparidis]MBP1082100.1 hypothetical protein [Bacillus capparidis]MED1096724.1 hypothetical protein [Bacillus capparidis]